MTQAIQQRWAEVTKEIKLQHAKITLLAVGVITVVVGGVVAFDSYQRQAAFDEKTKNLRTTLTTYECTRLFDCERFGPLYLDIRGRHECERIARLDIDKRIEAVGTSILTRYTFDCDGHLN
ncbi:hypothetical protein HBO07_17890 [Pseudomonas proteolytica]|uniref:hypothetical protein n=1 Tax=Pseudomonas proteolytica TaxID=219574 RepID=UPI0014767063|nr:hypothetical protein [Pseudomonas proteolytica]NMZ13158.1 hypothetical protein [Pseudomonas proteolytica]